MAEYRLSANVISRGDGKAAVAAAAYRSGTKLECERYGNTHDYTRRSGVRHEQILAPDNAPLWMRDRQQLWNAVEKVERKSNAQLSREIQLNLPHELNHEQRCELVQRFVQKTFVDEGMIADIAIHDPHKPRDEYGKPLPDDQIPPEKKLNHHAHVMLTMRELTGDGFHAKKSTPKARDWNNRNNLKDWRKQWALEQNTDLERFGHTARVSEKSLKDQGISRMPQIHLGHKAIANQKEYEAGNYAKPDPRFTRNVQILEVNKNREERLKLAREYLQLKKQIADIEQKRKALLLEIEQTKREAMQLAASINRKGIRGLIDTVTGKRREEKQRLEDLQSETRRNEEIAKKQQSDAERAKLDQQQQRERNRRQEELKARVIEQQRNAANDQTAKPPPEKPAQAPPSPQRTAPKRPEPVNLRDFQERSTPQRPQPLTRPTPATPKQPRTIPTRNRNGPDLER